MTFDFELRAAGWLPPDEMPDGEIVRVKCRHSDHATIELLAERRNGELFDLDGVRVDWTVLGWRKP